MPDLAGHIRKMETMHEVLVEDIDAIVQPTVLFSQTNKIKVPELVDTKNDPPKNYQNNCVTLPVNTQTSLSHSHPEDTSVASTKPPPRPVSRPNMPLSKSARGTSW